MAHRVDAAANGVEAANAHAPRDRTALDPQVVKLVPSDDAVLATSELRERGAVRRRA